MIWQDYVFGVGQFVFAIALLPAVIKKTKMPRSSSLLTGVTLGVFALNYYTLGLVLSGSTTIITSLLWLFLAWKRNL
jgi:hypothetical protein